MNATIKTIILALFLLVSGSANAQFFKKLKKKAKQTLEKTIEEEVDNSISDVIGGEKNNKKERESTATPPLSKNKKPASREKNNTPNTTPKNPVLVKNSLYNTLSLPAPNEYFEPTTLLTYKDLPIMASLDVSLLGKVGGAEYDKFNGLLKMKFFQPLFDTMDKTVWYPNRYAAVVRYPKEAVPSIIAQKTAHAAASSLISLEGCKRYFNNPDQRSSCYKNEKVWGGLQASDIRQNSFFKKFIAEQLDNLHQYAQKVPTRAYVVDQMPLIQYDFDNKGFVLALNPAKPEVEYTNSFFGTFAPRHDYENFFKNKNQPNSTTLFKITPEKVEELFNGKGRYGRSAYFVHKIEWYGATNSKIYNDYLKDPNFNKVLKNRRYYTLQYSYASPVIEIYLDKKLTQKIGEINLAKIDTGSLPNETTPKPPRKQPKVDFGNAIPLRDVEEKPKIPACTDSNDNRCEEKYLKEWINDKITNDKLKNWFSAYRGERRFRIIAHFILDTSGKMHIKQIRPFNEEAFSGIQKILEAHTLKMEPARRRGKPVDVNFGFYTYIDFNIRRY